MVIEKNVEILLASIANQIKQQYGAKTREQLFMIGIHTGGVWVAEQLHQMLELTSPLGKLNIAFYRDDFTRIGLHPHVQPSNLPIDINDRKIILVDDVLHTGRTVRAALNEIFDYGRPASIDLTVLVQRNGRELPIQPTFFGCALHLNKNEHVKLSGPDPLSLDVYNKKT